jgi:cytochrome b
MARRDFNRTILLPMRVWDAPTRLFHWLLVLLVALSYVSVQAGWMRIHLVSGYVVLSLLLFRLAWGFVGSDTARFRHFLGNPAHGLAHLARFRQRGPDTQVGHNEAGGWMVLLMLGLLAVQAVSGLFNANRHGIAGPLAKYAGERVTRGAHFVHGANFNLLAAVVGLHILAILAYALVKRHDLVRPMVTGVKRLPATTRQPRMASPILAAVLAALAGAAVWLLATRF